jgi:hypothetical protein
MRGSQEVMREHGTQTWLNTPEELERIHNLLF